MSTTTVNKRRFTAATEAWENAKKKRSAVLVAFMSCTTEALSPVHLLKGSTDVLQTIGAFCGLKNARKPREEQFNVKNEAQLRDHFAAYLKTTKFCLAPHHCRGLCCALPGDTLIMNRNGIVHDWIDTSQQELADRGWLHGGGLLFSYCEMVCNDPSQLEEGHGDGDEE